MNGSHPFLGGEEELSTNSWENAPKPALTSPARAMNPDMQTEVRAAIPLVKVKMQQQQQQQQMNKKPQSKPNQPNNQTNKTGITNIMSFLHKSLKAVSYQFSHPLKGSIYFF